MKLCDFCKCFVDNKCLRLGHSAKINGLRVKTCTEFAQREWFTCDVVYEGAMCVRIGFSSVEHLKKADKNKNLKIRSLW